MYRSHPKYTEKKRIYEIDVNVPLNGMVYNVFTKKWEKREIVKRSTKKDNQFWERPTPPPDYETKRKREIATQKTNPNYVDPQLQAYRNQEWDRRLNGFWFYNNGVATYITGLNYFYLVHWKIDIGYPSFRIPDLEFFYLTEYAVQDPCSLGIIETARRRAGKTFRAGAFLFELTSRSKNTNAGIQSKTLEDAKDIVFAKGVIMPFKYLIDFFVPIYDTEKGLTPKSELRFYKTSKRGATDDLFDKKIELESQITFKNAGKFAYDGSKLHRYVADESGKVKDINVYDRHQVLYFCLTEEERVIGKALYTTTVEDMDDGGGAFKKLWQASDPKIRDGNGRTKSGLYRFFMPAYRTLYFDKFGYGDEKKAREFYDNAREALKDDPRALASYIRKNPYTIEEAFFSEADTCLYDAMKLNRQMESISWISEKDLYFRGEFVWDKGVRDSTVVFKETSNGKFLVHKKINPFDTNSYNQIRHYGTKKVPNNSDKFKIGTDPFDHSITTSTERSNGAAYVLRAYDALDELSETFVVEYLNRPDTAEIFYEDMIKLAHFFGCAVLSEDNKVGLIKYFELRGYERFLHKMQGAMKYGVSATTKTHQQIAELHETYIEENVHKVIFKNLLLDWLKFNINKTTKFDAAMASGYTLMLANNNRFAKIESTKKHIYEVRDLFPF
jgi:hypothetical protein